MEAVQGPAPRADRRCRPERDGGSSSPRRSRSELELIAGADHVGDLERLLVLPHVRREFLVAISIDAPIVRMVVVPEIMRLMERATTWS
jgi:hypothetical protein